MMTTERTAITQELLSDIERSLVNVTRDYFPSTHYQLRPLVSLQPAGISLQVLGKTDATRESKLRQIAENAREVWAGLVPSLKLEWTVIGGSEAAGIIMRVVVWLQPCLRLGR